MKGLDFINKPYPVYAKRWPTIIIISVFIAFFLVIFQPFGLQKFQSEYKTFLLAGYGLVTFLLLIFNLIVLPWLFPRVFEEDLWTILKQLLWLSWIVTSISAGNYIYSTIFSITRWINLQGFLIFLIFTLLIAIFPVFVVTILNYNRALRRNIASSSSINALMSVYPKDHPSEDISIQLKSDSGKQEVRLLLSELLYIESDGNYLEIWHLHEGKAKSEIIRSTLINIQTQLPASGLLFKCHRAFILNLSHIEKVKGNSQGYRAIMKDTEKEIPVARAYSKSFREAIESMS